jgi:ribosomal protein L28
MARKCTICEKRGKMVWTIKKLRGKYNPTINKRKHPNLQWVLLPGSKKRVKACARCIKNLGKGKKK